LDGLFNGEHFIIVQRLLLALALGLLIGGERERAGKEVGLRTFAFVSLIGAISATLDILVTVVVLLMVAFLVVMLNVRALLYEKTLEMTTSAALFLTALIGLLAGQGGVFIPTAVGLLTAALLAAKVPLHGFTLGLNAAEVRAALTFGIIAFVIYPTLPTGFVDPWQLVDLSRAWLTVVLIAAIGLVNYVLLRLYGGRGLSYAIFLGALVNSSVAVADLARRVRGCGSAALAMHGLAVANAAMLLRNGVILVILFPAALVAGAPVVGAMLLLSALIAARTDSRAREEVSPASHLASPFSLRSALYFAGLLLLISVVGDLAQRTLGNSGFFIASIVGGFVSSASTAASAATLASQGKITPETAGLGAALASMASALVHAPILLRFGGVRAARWRALQVTAATIILGVAGFLFQLMAPSSQFFNQMLGWVSAR
jgi:uncharacterized membrane protein (DUF4010 family)